MTPARMARIHAAAFTRQRPWSAGEFRQLLGQPHTLQASPGPGFGLIRVIAPEAELLTIAVHPDAQGNGFGKAILADLCTLASQNGAQSMYLEVAADNAAALALYASAGFAKTGSRPDYYRHPDGSTADAVTMVLTLK